MERRRVGLTVNTFRRPFARSPRAADPVLAALLFATTISVDDGPGDSLPLRSLEDLPLVAVAVTAVMAAEFYRRRHTPLVALGVTLAGWLVLLPIEDLAPGLFAILSLYSCGRRLASMRLGLAALAATVAVLCLD